MLGIRPWPKGVLNFNEMPEPGFYLEYSLNRDHTEAYLSVPNWPKGLEYNTALGIIRQSVLVKFASRANLPFLDNVLPRLVQARQPFHGQIVASGEPAENGLDGWVEYFVSRPSREFLIKPDGTIDFKTRDIFRSVGVGEKILKLHPPTEGKPGITVLEEIIQPKPGRPIRLLPGINVITENQPDGTILVAATSAGQVHFEEKPFQIRVRVTPVLTIEGDVDFQTGNINFKGSAVINGSVLSGFSVNVTGNLTVNGIVEPGAKLTAGGDLVVEKGILGDPELGEQNPEIKAFGNIRALYVENARVTAEGDIFLRSSLNSWLSANGAIFIEKALVGGNTVALQSIVAGEIGNAAGAVTEVSCGISHSIRSRLELVVKILADLKSQIAEVEKNLNFVRTKGDKLEKEKREKLIVSLTQKRKSLEDQILKLELKKADLALALLKENSATISAQRFYPGVVLIIRSSRLKLETEYTLATFYQKMPEEILNFRPYSR